MTELILNTKKSVEENAELYFHRAKKSKKKVETIKLIIERFKKELQKLNDSKLLLNERSEFTKVYHKPPTKKWYHSLRWFFSSEGFLCVGGRDAETNELVIKRYTESTDYVFHTEIPGSPFFVIKTNGKTPSEETIVETAIATASFSRAWRNKLGNADVYYVFPDQLGKTPKSGEFLSKGAFIVSGKRNYFNVKLELAIGYNESNELICAPLSVVKKYCKKYMLVVSGDDKSSDAVKKIQKHLGGSADEIIRVLPSGGVKVILCQTSN